MKVTLHPAAEQGVAEAAAFHERQGTPLLAASFVAEFKRIATLLIGHPEIGSPRSKGRRGFSMIVFPYTVIYRVGADEIKVLVVKHDSKRPGFGGKRQQLPRVRELSGHAELKGAQIQRAWSIKPPAGQQTVGRAAHAAGTPTPAARSRRCVRAWCRSSRRRC